MKLEKSFAGALTLAPGEVEADAIAGCRNVALKRASVFGRAPVMHDLSVAFNAWGFLGEADPDLVAVRKPMFEGVANTVHHYLESRRIVDAVPERILRMSPQEVADTSKSDWRSCLDLDD